MTSTRSSSPAGDASTPTSPQLTPRSKIKAMLAAVDDESSDEGTAGPIDAKALFKSLDKTAKAQDEPSPLRNDDRMSSGEDEEEEEVIQPRGRMAARMRAFDATTTTTSKSPDVTPSHAGGETPSRVASAHHGENEEDVADDGDVDEDITVAARRRFTRPARSATPEPPADASRHSSPGLSVTPSKSVASRHSAALSESDDDLPANLGKSDRFKALLARKRQERLAKEAEEAHKQEERARRMAEQLATNEDEDEDVSDITDDDGGRKLTQQVSRPARKASKKALEEMNRETQRISRSLQLAHEAKTRKKLTKSSLLERFNFKSEVAPADTRLPSSSRPTTPGSIHQTDAEMIDAGTPPSSPPDIPKAATTQQDVSKSPVVDEDVPTDTILEDEHGDLLSLEQIMAQPGRKDKGKGKPIAIANDSKELKTLVAVKPKRQIRVKLPPTQANLVTIESDDELEVRKPRKGRMDAIFDRIPAKKAQESSATHILRRLAHLSSPGKDPSRGRNAKPSMTPGELHMTLQQRARAQAKLERDRRLELLRAKGVVVQTEEERAREREQVEDIVARARQEVEEIMQREREDAKKARKEARKNGSDDPLAWDDSEDDGSFVGSEEENDVDVELSGSDDEEGERTETGRSGDEAEDEDEPIVNPLFEDEAEEDGASEDEATPQITTDDASDEEQTELPVKKSRRSKQRNHIVSDDEEGIQATPKPRVAFPQSPMAPNTGSPKVPTSVLRSATKSFIPGLPVPAAGPAGLGLTQIFAGTMDDSQLSPAEGTPADFMPSFDNFPDSQFSATAGQSQNDQMVLDSQPTQAGRTQAHETQTQGVQLHYSQSQAHGFDSLMQPGPTQMSEFFEPTQDGGFQDFSPIKQRFVEPPQSTVDTVVLDRIPGEEEAQDSPLVKKKGKLRRRGEGPQSITSFAPSEVSLSHDGALSAEPDAGPVDREASASAFSVMEKAARRKHRLQKKFDKKKSKATEMVHEQAEESEDEYAGLGGADGEDSSEEDEELAKEMIDDAAGNDLDEAKLAGFFADRERAADAAQVDKLFRDITTGMLRKRRRGGDGNDFDLSDSDDGGEAKRRMKRRQFAKMQKALFADERIGKIAENPRNAAFLKSIEDRHSDDEWDFQENFIEPAQAKVDEYSQSQEQGQEGQGQEEEEEAIPDSQPANAGRKRTRDEDHAARPPPNARRTKEGGRPSSIMEVRRSLSTLLEEPSLSLDSVIPATEVGSDSEEERSLAATSSSNKENQAPGNSRRTKVAVVDRITLKRNSSSSVSTAGSRLAFAAPASGSGSTFKVPALLRRATTNSLMSNSSSNPATSSTSTAGAGHHHHQQGPPGLSKAGSFGDEGKLKKNAGKRSGVNYFARENERLAKVADAEKRREAKKWKGAEGRGRAVGGLFGAGKFE
ncbi:MRC1-like domain-containing protein [Xylariomycetidae sp. FL2044]|nr:MRC1-like domain-containing protein [Xylariomycetidae sp. FL2044]